MEGHKMRHEHHKRLSAAFVRAATTPGQYGDGGRGSLGLKLLVRRTPTGYLSKSWAQRIRINGKPTHVGLGSFPTVGLQRARDKALRNAQAIERGEDPRRRVSVVPTFEKAAEDFLRLRAPTWKAAKKVETDWRGTLKLYLLPAIGNQRIDRIGRGDLMAIVKPIWNDKRPTAKKVLDRSRMIFEFAVAEGHRTDNPTNGIKSALPSNGHKTEHQAALHHSDVGNALRKVKESDGYIMAILCFELVALTACRSGEARGATWDEFDLESKTWTIPAERMKASQEHRKPLSAAALDVLSRVKALPPAPDGIVFPSIRGKVQQDRRLSELLDGIEGTVHGLRSSFRDWCADNGVERDLAEQSLGHTIKGVEGAYYRSDILERRRSVMERWGAYVTAV